MQKARRTPESTRENTSKANKGDGAGQPRMTSEEIVAGSTKSVK